MRRSDLGDEAAVDDAMKWLDGLLGRIQAAADPGRPVARATLLGAQAEARRAAGKPDADAYARAAAAWEQLGRPEPAAEMRWRQAEALALAGDAATATAAVRTAHAAALRLGAEGLRADVERLAVRARLPLATAAKEPGRSIEQDPFGLTQREREVLGLLATGSTNREIGATLFMAEKTASVHVSRILSKLNARSRTEAAAIAFRHGLLEPSTAGRR